jgi:Large polyvalent protein associated domain 29
MRILTKESRLNSRQYQFNKLVENGYIHEIYNTLDIFTRQDGKYFTLKIYRGTSAKQIEYKNYHSEERRAVIIQQYKDNLNRFTEYKTLQKEKNKGKSSTHAGASAAIKAELKANFPNIKFSVTSDSFAGGDSVHIEWTDGVTIAEVEKFSSKYQYGHFNGMEDIYENTNDRDDIPQVKYVQERRNLSDTIIEAVAAEFIKVKSYTDDEINSFRDSPKQHASELLYKTSIPTNYTSLSIATNQENCSYNDYYKVIFEVPQTEQTETTNKVQEVATFTEVKGEINILDYSEKAFAVVGDTKPIKEKLKALGGSFNARLTCGAGWVFSKKKLDEVTKALSNEETETIKEVEKMPDTLRTEIIKTVEFFADQDIKKCGEITNSTKEIANVQNVNISKYENAGVQIYDNLQDINAAVKQGEVISLCNLSQLVNQ